jgi:hypothetical protein
LVDFVRTARRQGRPLREAQDVRHALAQMWTEIEVLESLTRRALWLVESGEPLHYESSQVKIFASELRQRLTQLALRVIGEEAQLAPEDPRAPLAGGMYRACEAALMESFAAGANEIQRDIVARAGLHLPRA